MKVYLLFNYGIAKLAVSLSFIFLSFSLNAQSIDLVIIGDSYPNKTSLKASLPVAVKTLEVSYSDELLSSLLKVVEEYPTVENVHLFSETEPTAIALGNDIFNEDALKTYSTILNGINDSGADREVKLFIYSCSLASNVEGLTFLNRLADEIGFNVLSASNCDSINEGEFAFDFSSSNTVVPVPSIFH